MKKEFFAVILLLLILVLSIMNICKLTRLTDDIAFCADETLRYAFEGHWDKSALCAETALSTLRKHEEYVHIVLHHSEIDALTSNLYDLLDAVYCESLPSVNASSQLVTSALESILSAEKIKIQSIF